MTNFEKAVYSLLEKESRKEKPNREKEKYLHDILFNEIKFRLKKGQKWFLGIRKGFLVVEYNEKEKLIELLEKVLF